MKTFFQSVLKHIDKLDASKLREQYRLAMDEMSFFDQLLNAMDRGLIAVDEEGQVTWSNPAAKTLLGMDPDRVITKLDIPLGRPSKREMTISYPEERDLELLTFPMNKGTLVYLRDTTAEKLRTEEELRAGATQAVRDLAAGVAHEIGNPLNALALNQQLIIRNPEKAVEKATQSLSQIKRLDGIIRGFLAALRPQKPNLAPGSLVEPLKTCLETMKNQFDERQISVTLDVPAALPAVALDRDQMEQVFFNLIKNALEAMKDGSSIGICLDSDDNNVSISFKDTGVGMSADQLAHLFEPYRTSKKKGTGLGLMITARIVNDHGGTIAAESTPGEGTTFTIKIPRIERRIRAIK